MEKEREIFNGWKQRSFKAKKLSTGRDVTAVQKLATKAKEIMSEILRFNDHKVSGHVTLITNGRVETEHFL